MSEQGVASMLKPTIAIRTHEVGIGTIANLEHKRLMGRGRKLDLEVDGIKLSNGKEFRFEPPKRRVPVRSIYQIASNRTVSALLNWTTVPLIFAHGQDVTIPRCTEIPAYSDGDVNIDPGIGGGEQNGSREGLPRRSRFLGKR